MRDRFNKGAARITSALGSPYALSAAVVLVILWAVSGPLFQFSEEWQLIINQASQNRDSRAIHLKLRSAAVRAAARRAAHG